MGFTECIILRDTECVIDGNHVLGTPEKEKMNKFCPLEEFAEIVFYILPTIFHKTIFLKIA